jgi:hypothetical protein
MIKAACHCTAVRFELAGFPKWVVDCNCTLCRRYGALWGYYKTGDVVLIAGDGETDSYVWGGKQFAFHWCKRCGCLTHHTAFDVAPPRIRAVNARMIPTLDPSSVKLQHTDNSHTGFFWTRAADKFEPGGEPKMAAPGPDDWR